MTLEQACILGDAVATSFHAVTKRAQVSPGMTVVLVAVGGVGLHALHMAKLAGGGPLPSTSISAAWIRPKNWELTR